MGGQASKRQWNNFTSKEIERGWGARDECLDTVQ